MLNNSGWIRLRGRSALLATLLAGVAFGAGSVAWSAAGTAGPPLGLPPMTNQAGFADLVAKVRPAVVQITTTERVGEVASRESPDEGMPDFQNEAPFGDMFRQFFGAMPHFQQPENSAPSHALGSGFVIDPAGYVVTNNHVIDGATRIEVTLSDGGQYPAKIVGRDPKTDLALLKINAAKALPYVAWGDSGNERAGDWVIAMGNPYGLGGTATAGIVSAHDRDINSGAYDDYLQIDAPINPGNSGGPLFDQSGRVIGIDTAIYSPSGGSVGIGFAIPSNLARHIVAQLRERGKVERGWLGVQMQEMTPALAKAVGLPRDEGVIVDSVQPNSPAAGAKLQQGDVITGFNGMEIKAPRDLAVEVANTPAGKTAILSIWRNRTAQNLDVTIGTQASERIASAQNASPSDTLGMSLQPLTPQDRDQLGVQSSLKGALVGQVDPDSRAWESGVRPGDVIVRVGNNETANPSEVAKNIRTAQRENREQIPVVVMRDGSPYYLGLNLAAG
jgi:serine protease Do